MADKHIPLYVRHAPAPGVKGFAVLAGVEAVVRGAVISVLPLAMYRAYQDATQVSTIYFLIGFVSLIVGLAAPGLTRILPRRFVYTFGASLYVGSALLGIQGGQIAIALAVLGQALAAVIVFVCANAYLLDYIERAELGRVETLKLFYSALAWCAGPALGVMAYQWWAPAPFILSGVSGLVLLAVFWGMRLGDGKLISRARAPAQNPLAFLGRFLKQPRLISGWMFAVLRSCGWWAYLVYIPIYAVENGFGEQVGGWMLTATNALLFASPFFLKIMRKLSVKVSVRTGFFFGGCLFALAGVAGAVNSPLMVLTLLGVGSAALIFLDICGGLPFLMSVKPSERTEMSAIYASYRDVSGILTPGVAGLILIAAPVYAVFGAAGAGLLAAWGVAGRLHPRLGEGRMPRSE
ncbi:MAG: MFS transporter [Pikeienuella sp.]